MHNGIIPTILAVLIISGVGSLVRFLINKVKKK